MSAKSTCVKMEVPVLNTREALHVTVPMDIGEYFVKREVSLAVVENSLTNIQLYIKLCFTTLVRRRSVKLSVFLIFSRIGVACMR